MTNQQGAPEALAHELFTAAQLAPGEGISDAVARIAALVEAQQPAPSAAAATKQEGEHLFELWWSEYMPEATQERAWKAWTEAPRTDGVGVASHTPQADSATTSGNWVSADDVNRLVRELDVALNGKAGAAAQASLCDVVAQVRLDAAKRGQPLLAPQADSQPALHSEPWYGHQFKEVRRGYWQCSCGKAIAEAVPSASKDSYPPLPNRYAYDDDGEEMFTADHMRAYVDADRAARAPAESVTAPAGGTNTKTAELLSTTVGLLMGYREGGARQPYRPGSVIAKTVDEVVEHLNGWPYPEPTPPAQAADSVLEDAARLEQIAEAIRDYHHALDMRKHGGLAESAAFSSICNTMGMHWNRGEEAARRAARKQGGA